MSVRYVAAGYVKPGYVNAGIWVNWGTRVIFVPRRETTLVQSVPTEIRELDLNVFRLRLKDLEDDATGIVYPDTHRHIAPIPVGGVLLARVVELLNGYTITFEDGDYAVNLIGANSNVGDRVNVNRVSVRTANSAGLVQDVESAPSLMEIITGVRQAVLADLLATTIPVDLRKVVGTTVTGSGTEASPWGPP